MAETLFLSSNEFLGSVQLPGGPGTLHYCCIACGKEFLTEVRPGESQHHRWLHSYCLDHMLRAQPHWPFLLYEAAWGNKPLWMWPADHTLDLPPAVLRMIFLAECNHLDYLES